MLTAGMRGKVKMALLHDNVTDETVQALGTLLYGLLDVCVEPAEDQSISTVNLVVKLKLPSYTCHMTSELKGLQANCACLQRPSKTALMFRRIPARITLAML